MQKKFVPWGTIFLNQILLIHSLTLYPHTPFCTQTHIQ